MPEEAKRKAEGSAGGEPAAKKAASLDTFKSVFPGLVEDILGSLPQELPEEAKAYVKKMCDYNCFGGKMNRGITTGSSMVAVLKAQGKEPSPEALFQAQVVGWCIEWLQACFLVMDDIMDESITRRGQPCWYKVPTVGKMAINDGMILESCVYLLLKKHLGSEPGYHATVDLFQDTALQTKMGQLLDMSTENTQGEMDLTRYTLERYKLIVKYKTAFYSFYLPVATGLILAGMTGAKELEQTRDICLAMGEYFQIQDDFLDCYGDPETIGKIGTDIQDKKCGWLCVQALLKCSPEQRKVLDNNYGVDDPAKIETVKKLYNELKLKEAFEAYEEESYKEICGLIEKCEGVPKEVFEGLLAKIYKRSK